ncbi:hypothetical protein OA435_01405, partial [Pelagibacteraceae bacterium]|nr:hypothetical protein [Pelagibacteraceae bacterium]
DTLLTIPNQNLFRIANEKTTFSDAFKMADDVLYAGVRGVTDLMVQPGMINLDFSDIKTVMSEMGKAMMGTGEAQGEGRAIAAAEAAIANPLIDDVSLKGAKGLIINITGGKDITLYEVDEAANRIKQEVDEEANIIYGTTCDDRLEGIVRVSIVATGIDVNNNITAKPIENFAPININNDIYKQDIEKSESLTESFALQEHSLQDGSNLDEEINELSNEEILNNQNSENIDLDKQTNINQIETSSLEENTDDKVFDQNEVSEAVDQTESNYISEEVSNTSSHIEKPNETSVRRLSLFDTLSTENKSEDISSVNEVLEKTEPVFASSEDKIEENEAEDKKSEDNNLSIDEKEEFSAEQTESSEIDDEFNQETEEELLDIPTFLRRQAN